MNWGELVVKSDRARMGGIVSALSSLKGDSRAALKESMSDFQNVEHRLELVAKIGGISFVNDSKATTVNATWWSIESQKGDVTWIIGGGGVEYNYDALYSVVVAKVKNIICFGEVGVRVSQYFEKTDKNVVLVADLQDAVKISVNVAQKGEVVLFSPACSSFNSYRNYAERGCEFKRLVKAL